MSVVGWFPVLLDVRMLQHSIVRKIWNMDGETRPIDENLVKSVTCA